MALTLDREELFQILHSQNYWEGEVSARNEGFILRQGYLQPLLEEMEAQAITLITGPRRAGKTVLLRQLARQLIETRDVDPRQIIYLSLEDFRLHFDTTLELLEAALDLVVEHFTPGGRIYYFIDEVQRVSGFERYLRTVYDGLLLKDLGVKFVITGSNSRLLAPELATLLTGRTTSFRVYPFSFPEFLSYHGRKAEEWQGRNYYQLSEKSWIRSLFTSYLELGGLPESFTQARPRSKLREYLENVLFNDLLQRYPLRDVALVKSLAIFLAGNVGNRLSINRLAQTLHSDRRTLKEYLEALEQTLLFFYLPAFSHSWRKQVRSQLKPYAIDTGLAQAVGFKPTPNRGFLLENLVAIELKRRGEEVYYHKAADRKSECDFVLRRGYQVGAALQVCEELGQPDTRRREMAGLVEALKAYELQEGLILTRNHYETLEVEGCTIRIRPVWYWLLKGPSPPDASSTLPSPPGHEPLAASP